MAIVACLCGKQFRVKDEHLGEMAKCPSCGRELLLKAVEEPAPAVKPDSSEADDGTLELAEDPDETFQQPPPRPTPAAATAASAEPADGLPGLVDDDADDHGLSLEDDAMPGEENRGADDHGPMTLAEDLDEEPAPAGDPSAVGGGGAGASATSSADGDLELDIDPDELDPPKAAPPRPPAAKSATGMPAAKADAPAGPTKECPKCQESISESAVVCTNCGYNFKKKEQARTRTLATADMTLEQRAALDAEPPTTAHKIVAFLKSQTKLIIFLIVLAAGFAFYSAGKPIRARMSDVRAYLNRSGDFASIRVPTPWLSTSMPESVPVKATQRVNGEEVELSGSYTPADRRLVLNGRKVPPTGGAPIEVSIDRVLPTLAMIAVTEADLDALNARLAEAPEEARLAAEVDGKSRTPLMVAVEKGSPPMVQALLGHLTKADVNAKTETGYTPLLLAVSQRPPKLEIVKALIQAGADPNDRVGVLAAYDFAQQSGSKPVLEYIRAVGGKSILEPDDPAPGTSPKP